MPNSSAVIMDNGRVNNCGNAGIGVSVDEDGDTVGGGVGVCEGVGVRSGVGIAEGQVMVNERRSE